MTRIVALDGQTLNPGDNPWDEVAALGDLTVYPRTAAGELLQRSIEADVLIVNKVPLDAGTISQLPKLKLIAVTATGYNIVDVTAAANRGVLVCNVPEYGTDSVAQFVFALLLELCHHVVRHDAAVKAGEWQRSPDWCMPKSTLTQLAGLTMGIVGFGRIGQRVGELAHAFGMNVLAAGRQGNDDTATRNPPAYEPFAWRHVDELFSQADVVSLHCPLMTETANMVNAERLAMMKSSAMLINTARGGLVVEADLADGLRQGRPAAAAVDVVSTEPIRADNPLLAAPKCLITPHIAWATTAARRSLMQATAQNIRAWQEGRPINVVTQ